MRHTKSWWFLLVIIQPMGTQPHKKNKSVSYIALCIVFCSICVRIHRISLKVIYLSEFCFRYSDTLPGSDRSPNFHTTNLLDHYYLSSSFFHVRLYNANIMSASLNRKTLNQSASHRKVAIFSKQSESKNLLAIKSFDYLFSSLTILKSALF